MTGNEGGRQMARTVYPAKWARAVRRRSCCFTIGCGGGIGKGAVGIRVGLRGRYSGTRFEVYRETHHDGLVKSWKPSRQCRTHGTEAVRLSKFNGHAGLSRARKRHAHVEIFTSPLRGKGCESVYRQPMHGIQKHYDDEIAYYEEFLWGGLTQASSRLRDEGHGTVSTGLCAVNKTKSSKAVTHSPPSAALATSTETMPSTGTTNVRPKKIKGQGVGSISSGKGTHSQRSPRSAKREAEGPSSVALELLAVLEQMAECSSDDE